MKNRRMKVGEDTKVPMEKSTERLFERKSSRLIGEDGDTCECEHLEEQRCLPRSLKKLE